MFTKLTGALKARRPLVLTAIAVPAAVVLIGGSATAASLITSADIKNQTIESWDIAAGGVASSEVRNQSLQSWDLDRGSVAASELRDGSVGAHELTEELRAQVEEGGPAGPAGEDGTDGIDGTNGADGADGVSGYEVVGRTADSMTIAAGATETVSTECRSANQPDSAPEKAAIGGGVKTTSGNLGDVVVNATAPSGIAQVSPPSDQDPAGVWAAKSWTVTVSNMGGADATVQPYVLCALVG